MASSSIRARRQAAAPQRAPLDLPILRVESQYRNETRTLQRQEREQYSNILWNMVRLDRGPPVTITDIVGANQDAPIDAKKEPALDANVGFYLDRADSAGLVRVLKFYCTYLMQQARKENDAELQRFLLFKAADFARMIVQHSELSVNADAEALVFSIFVALGGALGEPFRRYARQEETVYQVMRRLALVPQDITVRLRLAEALTAQTSYFDALVQYHTLLRILMRRGAGGDRHRGWIVARIGDLLHQLSRVTSSQLNDARKLRMFIDRYNREFAERGHTLPTLDNITVPQVTRVRNALMTEANRWYQQAVNAPTVDRRQRLRMAAQAGENMNMMGQHAHALTLLEQNYPLWQRIPESTQTLEEHSRYLKQLTSAAIQLKRRDVMTWATKAASEVNGKLGAIEQRRKERELLKASLLG